MNNNFFKILCDTAGEENVFENEPMDRHTTFRIGGPADFFVTPESASALCEIIERCRESGVDYIVLGNGSNVLVSDKGYRGVVIQVQKNLCSMYMPCGNEIYAEAGVLLSKISAEAAKNSLTGFEFASGIPGTLGGAVLMNAGAYGGEIKDVLKKADIFKPGHGIVELEAQELQLGYRTSIIKHRDWVVLGALIKLKKGVESEIKSKIEELRQQRNEKQPYDVPSAGSAFKRPEGHFAGKLIMDAGLRGYSIGDAAVSEKHCGFLINKGSATAADMKRLFDEVISAVRDRFGVTLQPEVRFIGEF